MSFSVFHVIVLLSVLPLVSSLGTGEAFQEVCEKGVMAFGAAFDAICDSKFDVPVPPYIEVGGSACDRRLIEIGDSYGNFGGTKEVEIFSHHRDLGALEGIKDVFEDAGKIIGTIGEGLCDLPGPIGDAVPEVIFVTETKSTCDLIREATTIDLNNVDQLVETVGSLCACLGAGVQYLEENVKDIADRPTVSEAVATALESADAFFECLENKTDIIESNKAEMTELLKTENDLVLWGAEIGLGTYATFITLLAGCIISGSTCEGLIEILTDLVLETFEKIGNAFVGAVRSYFLDRIAIQIRDGAGEIESKFEETTQLLSDSVELCIIELEEDLANVDAEVKAVITAFEGSVDFVKNKYLEIQSCYDDVIEALDELQAAVEAIIEFADVGATNFIDIISNLSNIDAIISVVQTFADSPEVKKVRDCIRSLINVGNDIKAQRDMWVQQLGDLETAVQNLLDVDSCEFDQAKQSEFLDQVQDIKTSVEQRLANIADIIDLDGDGEGFRINAGLMTYSQKFTFALDLPCNRPGPVCVDLGFLGEKCVSDVPMFYLCRWDGSFPLPNEHVIYLAVDYPGSETPPDSVKSMAPPDPEIPDGTGPLNGQNVCVEEKGFPADEKDNDCDQLVDNQICNADDLDTEGKTLLDCMCNPPRLDSSLLENKVIGCSEDRSPDVLGFPEYTTDEANQCLAGRFLVLADVNTFDLDPASTCGRATYERTFIYEDSVGQKSNSVTQVITTTPEPPILVEDEIQDIRFFDCTDPITKPSLLAPLVPITGDHAFAPCAVLDVLVAYQDIQLDFIGCPENPANETGGTYKGWNVLRRWSAIDNCLQQDTFDQVVVRTDESKPVFTSIPPIRVQSCRASFDPASSGFPVAEDNCDPSDVINPDLSQPADQRGGRVVYSDAGSQVSGCPRDFERSFEITDRVCNTNVATQTIQAEAFEFIDSGSRGSTHYDQSSLLPLFAIRTGEKEEYYQVDYPDDTLVMVDEDGSDILPVRECVANGTLEYLDTSVVNSGTGSWHPMLRPQLYQGLVPLESSEVIEFDEDCSTPTFTFGLLHYPSLTGIFEEDGDSDGNVLFRIPVTCAEAIETMDVEQPGRFESGAVVHGRVAVNLHLQLGQFVFENAFAGDTNYLDGIIPVFEVQSDIETTYFDGDNLLFEESNELPYVGVRSCDTHGPIEYKAGDEWLPLPHYSEMLGMYASGKDFIEFSEDSNPRITFEERYMSVLLAVSIWGDEEDRIQFRFLAGCYLDKRVKGKGKGKGKGSRRQRYVEGRGVFALKLLPPASN